MNSYLFYDGPSALTGEPIVGAAVMLSSNRKTGPMVQTYILDKNSDPITARKTGADESVCGDCALKKSNSCYVLLHHTPNMLYKNLHRMKEINLKHLSGRNLRIGSFGDPAAIPIEVWDTLKQKSNFHTGYTHQWERFTDFKRYCQASVETPEQAEQAQAAGWKTFRVALPDEPLLKDEALCPYPRVQCNQCGLCDGSTKNIATPVHGSWHPKKFIEMREAA